jgi:VanZ family protein
LSELTNSEGRRPTRRATWHGVLRWLPPVAWMAVIFAASHTPAARIPSAGPWDVLVKKGGHLASYALLAWLWLRALRPALSPPRLAWAAFAIAVLYAASDEVHQTFVEGRNGTPVDVAIDAAGALLAILLWRWRRTRQA